MKYNGPLGWQTGECTCDRRVWKEGRTFGTGNFNHATITRITDDKIYGRIDFYKSDWVWDKNGRSLVNGCLSVDHLTHMPVENESVWMDSCTCGSVKYNKELMK